MHIALWILIFVLALAVLLKSTQIFVGAAQKISQSTGLSSFWVGMTLLTLSTALPELSTSLWASGKGMGSIVASTVAGSNIMNILLIGGGMAVLNKRLLLSKDTWHSQIGFLLGSTLLWIVTIYDGQFHWYEGLLMIALYGIYVVYNAQEHAEGRFTQWKNSLFASPITGAVMATLVLSGIGIGASSFFVIQSIKEIASSANLAPSLLGTSLLALGTSLPELLLCWTALKQKEVDLALGNLIGSNVFNASIVMALPSFIHSLSVDSSIIILGIPFLLMATLLFAFTLTHRKFYAYEGAVYLLLFFVFTQQLFTTH